MASMGYIHKSDYIKVRKAHIALCEAYEKCLEIIKENLPENGKRFDSRTCKALESKFKESELKPDCTFRIWTTASIYA